jgi:hypothetical protein
MRSPAARPAQWLLPALMALAPLPLTAQGARLEGRTVDAVSGAPIAGVDIVLRALPDGEQLRTASGDNGVFSIGPLPPARYALRMERLAYLVREDTLSLAAGAALQLDFALTPSPVPLPDVTATGRVHPPLNAMGAFWERRRRNIGYFLTREEIEQIRPLRTEDVFRKVPGVSIHSMGYGRVATFNRVRNASGQPCIPAFFVNGIPYAMTDRGLDDFRPDDIEAIEVYSGTARIPPEFNATGGRQPPNRSDIIVGNPRCGVIVLWTRRD